MKLKFDRLIDIKLKGKTSTIVPTGEYWRVSFYTADNYSLTVNGTKIGNVMNTGVFVGGAKLENEEFSQSAIVQGVAFKVI